MSSLSQNPDVTQSNTGTQKVDTKNVGSQTFETCLVPCDACFQTQCVLRKTGEALIELFQSEGLPSSLQPLSVAVRDTVELGQMSAADVAQWGAEEHRDIRRLTKHLQDVRGTVEPLKANVVTLQTENNRLKSDVKRLQKEQREKVENYQAINVQLEFSVQKAQRSVKEAQHSWQEEKIKSQKEIKSLMEKNSSLMEKVTMQENTIKVLETETNLLKAKIKELEKELGSNKHQLQNNNQQLRGDISELQLCLHKEKAKFNSACRQHQLMQAKQKSLVERVNTLDEECEELQKQVAESEEKQVELHGQIQQLLEDKEQLQAQVNKQKDSSLRLEKDKQILSTKVNDLEKTERELRHHLKTCVERERLLVAFPDLNPLPQAQSSGNVILDMKQQFKTNCIRIKVLEQENQTLYSSLLKLKTIESNHELADVCTSWPKTEQFSTSEIPDSLLQSGRAERLDPYRKEAGEENGLKSASSEDQMTSSASSVQLHFQTLQLSSFSAKSKKSSSTESFSSAMFKQRWK